MSVEDDYNILKDTINDVWANLYGKDDVDTIYKLKNRILYIADDRNCWVFNTKQSDKEVKRLEQILKEYQP